MRFTQPTTQREDYYSIAYIAIFGGLWGFVEILLGNVLHAFSVPFKGTILSALGSMICLIGGTYLPSRRHLPIFSMAIVALIIRLFSFGIFKIHVFLSIFTAGVLMQSAVSIFGYNLLGYIIAGIGACLSPYISGVLFFGIVFGQGWEFINHGLLTDSSVLHRLVKFGKIAILVLLGLNGLIGSFAGMLAFYFGKQLKPTHDA